MKRPQTLNYVNGYAVPGDTMQMGTSVRSQPLPAGQAAKTGEILDVGPALETLPAWVAYDRKVLRFGAYFKEAVTEDPVENFRIRKCVPLLPSHKYVCGATIAAAACRVARPRTAITAAPAGYKGCGVCAPGRMQQRWRCVLSASRGWLGRCLIYLYLEDDSIHVAEPKQQNSGIPQVRLTPRHALAPPPHTSQARD
jgi:hypothetical protein